VPQNTSHNPAITPAHVRAARAWLYWSQKDLSEKSGIFQRAIAVYEAETSRATVQSLEKMFGKLMETFVEAGLRLTPDGINIQSFPSEHKRHYISFEPLITRNQFRAARGWLYWTQHDLTAKSGISQRTIAMFESGKIVPHDASLKTLTTFFIDAGIQFHFDGMIGTGISVSR
jgi:predicted transcriptional regulator